MPPRRAPLLLAVLSAIALVVGACSSGDGASAEGTGTAGTGGSTTTAGPTTTTSATIETTETTGTTGNGSDEATTATTSPPGEVVGGCSTVEAGVSRFTSTAGGAPIQVRVFVPPGFEGSPLPAVLDWHGLGSNGQQQLTLTAYTILARSEGFVAVHPTGAPAAGDSRNGWELAQFDDPARDDLAMVDEVIDRLVGQLCVDPDRIYSTGLSNGGFFTSRLVCERADRIAAAVSVAGVTHPDDCDPSRPVPYLAFHGTDDRVVPFDGGRSVLQGGLSNPATDAFFDQSMPEEFAQFATDFGCEPEAEAVSVGDEVVRHDYRGCDDGIPLAFYEITGGGHTWPGSPIGPLLTGALGRTTDQVDATAEGWAFMSRFRLP
jgi:polyhydroxybutyrate depolymerase